MGSPLLALSWMVTLKDFFGMEKVELDKDPVKDKIKQSWLQRKYGAYDSAVEILHQALNEANERKEPMAVTRVIDELANTYYQKGDWAEAERCFRDTIQRMVTLHGTKDSDPVFIGISLKLADLLARRGEIDNAETGLTHCLRKQMKTVDAHLAKNSVARGAMVEDRHPIDTKGASHSDPLALFGMCLDAFAHFLVTYRDESRLEEADEYMGEVLKISYQIYGSRTAHSVHMASNFGTMCVIKNRFPLAVKYLSYAVERAAHIDECAQMLPTLYCSYAEALFHSNRKDEAVEWARRALSLGRSADEKTRKYISTFLADLENETGRRKRFYFF